MIEVMIVIDKLKLRTLWMVKIYVINYTELDTETKIDRDVKLHLRKLGVL